MPSFDDNQFARDLRYEILDINRNAFGGRLVDLDALFEMDAYQLRVMLWRIEGIVMGLLPTDAVNQPMPAAENETMH